MITPILLAVLAFMLAMNARRSPKLVMDPLPFAPKIPLLGSLPFIVQKGFLLSMYKWAAQIGPLFWLQLGMESPVLVVTSVKAARAVFNSRSLEVRSRSSLYENIPAADLLLWDDTNALVMTQHNVISRLSRKVATLGASDTIPKASQELVHMLSEHVGKTITQSEMKTVVEAVISAVSTRLVLGLQWSGKKAGADGRVKVITGYFETLMRISPFKLEWAVPQILKLAPILIEHKAAQVAQARQAADDAVVGLRELALASEREKGPSNEEEDSIFKTIRSDPTRFGLTDEEELYMLKGCLLAVFDTSSSVLSAIISCLAAQPYWQQRIFLELSSLEEGADLAEQINCSSVSAFVKEVFRFFPVVFHLPRVASEDFEVDGVFVQAGTKVLHETWIINRDPDVFGPDADDFNPQRHIDRSSLGRYGHATFGLTDLRSCAGRDFAHKSMLAYTVRLVTAFHIRFQDPSEQALGIAALTKNGPRTASKIQHGPLQFSPRFP